MINNKILCNSHYTSTCKNQNYKIVIQMMQKVILSALILSFRILVAAQSQVITIEDAIEIALEDNYQLKQAENNRSKAELQELSAEADSVTSHNPTLNRGRHLARRFAT